MHYVIQSVATDSKDSGNGGLELENFGHLFQVLKLYLEKKLPKLYCIWFVVPFKIHLISPSHSLSGLFCA